ncbi:2-oxoisovalerate dehydrogenase E2 component (dihydrolipoyl transacylase) [Geomicrobium halophilum]|uniref:Dihydrolipoamide acetyltransferase component of pyruvate dehydrogenase complex n=1 Tax=Geomicrobium halophilum TaxID=549000 RepID=A0A841Q0J1_9BACL|nr:dihydrolipoamide acetyltransferase family protein [Geomicrobium halophilum]MBB6448948.1 2-oxoisovalerate dehydrogenase E2 component (dihydrolipoyl transacylase) [Geomicrobium halophilum]
MNKEITMPKLGESVTEGTLTRWLVSPGDLVNKYEPIAEVDTDKVNAEVPSSYTGTMSELVASENDTVQVGDLIAYIETDSAPKEDDKRQTSANHEKPQVENQEDHSLKKRYSPAVLALSQKHNIDLEQISGSGRGGRITRKDVEKEIASASDRSTLTELGQQLKPAVAETEKKAQPEDDIIPVTGVRKAIASNMSKSKQEIPHAWTMVEVDVTNIVRYRDQVKDEFRENEGIPLTFMPFFMQAVASGLKKYPELNATWQGDRIVRKKAIHLSMAIATEEALYVPVIQHADEKNLRGMARSLSTLADKTRKGQLNSDDMQGGTFTLNNTGSFGSVQSMPIINPPQAAILSVESIVKRPVVKEDDMIAIRHMVNLCLSLDHRVLDGLICGRFLAYVKDQLENFNGERSGI